MKTAEEVIYVYMQDTAPELGRINAERDVVCSMSFFCSVGFRCTLIRVLVSDTVFQYVVWSPIC